MTSMRWLIGSGRRGGGEVCEATRLLYPIGLVQPSPEVSHCAARPEPAAPRLHQQPLPSVWAADDHAALETTSGSQAAGDLPDRSLRIRKAVEPEMRQEEICRTHPDGDRSRIAQDELDLGEPPACARGPGPREHSLRQVQGDVARAVLGGERPKSDTGAAGRIDNQSAARNVGNPAQAFVERAQIGTPDHSPDDPAQRLVPHVVGIDRAKWSVEDLADSLVDRPVPGHARLDSSDSLSRS